MEQRVELDASRFCLVDDALPRQSHSSRGERCQKHKHEIFNSIFSVAYMLGLSVVPALTLLISGLDVDELPKVHRRSTKASRWERVRQPEREMCGSMGFVATGMYSAL